MPCTHLAMALALLEQNRDREGALATYLITWVCYGAWLPGQSGAVLRTQNGFGAPFPDAQTRVERNSKRRMAQQPYLLDAVRRQVVLKSAQQVCTSRGWPLLAAHVRTNHVHVVTSANRKPEQVMVAMKAYCSRALNEYALDGPERIRWARHASTRYLWTRASLRAAIEYVMRQQGEPMAIFEMVSPLPNGQGSEGDDRRAAGTEP